MERLPTRKLTIVAQDPSILIGKKILTAQVDVPFESLGDGPAGHRVAVIDYDATSNTMYKPLRASAMKKGGPFEKPNVTTIRSNPNFHAQNVYAIVMRTLARFESALGRRVPWGFNGHRLHVTPHAMCEANAFYSREDEGLIFGYFPASIDSSRKMVFSCLSHDIIAHETTHAILDGLRELYLYPSTEDQEGFHEGFADLVAMLAVFSLKEVVSVGLDYRRRLNNVGSMNSDEPEKKIHSDDLSRTNLETSFLLGMAEEFGEEFYEVRGAALRRSATLRPDSQEHKDMIKSKDPHDRGELFVAAMMNAFLRVWCKRIEDVELVEKDYRDRSIVVEEGAKAAEHLLTMAIRAIDYCPSTGIYYKDFLSALLTADKELYPDDGKYNYRMALIESFKAYGMTPSSKNRKEYGIWERMDPEKPLNYHNIHFESLKRNPDEVMRFIWENMETLGLSEKAVTNVLSVVPCRRISVNGFLLQETVAQYVQTMIVKSGELDDMGITRPEGMLDGLDVELQGGGTLLFDEYGQLKYHVHAYLKDAERQAKRLEYLFDSGYYDIPETELRSFARGHHRRLMHTFRRREV